MDFPPASRRVSSLVRLIENMKFSGVKTRRENCIEGIFPWFSRAINSPVSLGSRIEFFYLFSFFFFLSRLRSYVHSLYFNNNKAVFFYKVIKKTKSILSFSCKWDIFGYIRNDTFFKSVESNPMVFNLTK